MSLAYHRLRAAQMRFGVAPPQLQDEQRQQVEREADAASTLEARVLATPEAAAVQVDTSTIDSAVTAIRNRYGSDGEMTADLAVNGLDERALHAAVERELRFDALMTRLVADLPEPSGEELRHFYDSQRERFERPELRRASHILITLNDDYAENSRDQAAVRIDAIATELAGSGERFAELATSHSECPTAMEGGKLGEIKKGTLYPELDEALFDLEEGRVSGVIETEVGLHLLWCEAITPGKQFAFDEVRERIRIYLIERRHRDHQQAWLRSIEAVAPNPV